MPITVKTLDRKRSCYRPEIWNLYRLLSEGGHAIEGHRGSFLPKNPAESQAWYTQRLSRFEYKNIVGTILSEYSASVFRAPLQMMLAKGDGEKRPQLPEWWTQFIANPKGDGDGDFSQLMGCALDDALKFGEKWLFVSMPETTTLYSSRAEQEAAGDLEAKITELCPEHVINYGWDARGLSWVRLRFEIYGEDELGSQDEERKKIRWLQIDRQVVRTFEIEVKGGESPGQDEPVTEIASYMHKLAFADEGRGIVPVLRLALPKKLWMLDKIASIAKAELRKRNELGWYESLACIPQLVRKTDDDVDPFDPETRPEKRGVQYVHRIGREDDQYWLELEGNQLEHLGKRLDALEQDIYKAVSQMATSQGMGSSAAVMARSGASKARDAISKVILCAAYADWIRDAALQVFDLVAAARGEQDLDWEASGCDQHDALDSAEVSEWYATASAVPVKSETLKRELEKRFARQMLPDADATTMDKIQNEIEKATYPDPDEMLGPMPSARTGDPSTELESDE